MYRTVILVILSLCLYGTAPAQSRAADSRCVRLVAHVQNVYDQYPDSDIVCRTIKETFPVLRRQPDLTCYLMVCNIYIDWLFRHGNLDASRREMRHVSQIAATARQPELLAIARRAEGQFMMRLGFNDRARQYFERALQVCPDYRRLQVPSTYYTIVLQLAKVYMRLNRPSDAERMLMRLDAVLYDMDRTRRPDRYNWLHARVAALHAGLEMMRGNHMLCRQWLERSRAMMQPGVPAKYYATYFIVRNHQYLHDGKYREALAGADTLLNIGFDIVPVRPEFLRQRATALQHLGRGMEAAQTLERYIGETQRADRMVDAVRMELTRDEYRLQQAQAERLAAEHGRRMLMLACALLAAAFAALGWMSWRLRRKTLRMARLLRNADRFSNFLARRNESAAPATAGSPAAPALDAVGLRGVDFIEKQRAFCHIDGGRAALAAHLGMSERAAVAAVAAVTGTSFKSYTNTLKLKESRRLLEADPLMSVAAVARACGFGTVRTYQALFKDMYGMSPTQYRNSLPCMDE